MAVVIRAHYDGKTIVPDEPVDLPFNEPLEFELRQSSAELAWDQEKAKAAIRRIVARAKPVGFPWRLYAAKTCMRTAVREGSSWNTEITRLPCIEYMNIFELLSLLGLAKKRTPPNNYISYQVKPRLKRIERRKRKGFYTTFISVYSAANIR